MQIDFKFANFLEGCLIENVTKLNLWVDSLLRKMMKIALCRPRVILSHTDVVLEVLNFRYFFCKNVKNSYFETDFFWRRFKEIEVWGLLWWIKIKKICQKSLTFHFICKNNEKPNGNGVFMGNKLCSHT